MSELEPNPNEDVLIKLIRVLANLAINEIAGAEIANRADLFEILIKILGIFKDYLIKFLKSF